LKIYSGHIVRYIGAIKGDPFWEELECSRKDWLMRPFSTALATKWPRTFAGVAAAIVLLIGLKPANAMGCLEGAMLGGIAGQEEHHTFLGIFGGCAGGIYVHHLYSKWKKTHPNGTLNDFVSDHEDVLPEGWADRLSPVGESSNLPAGKPVRGQ
jgi:hypothetical protein